MGGAIAVFPSSSLTTGRLRWPVTPMTSGTGPLTWEVESALSGMERLRVVFIADANQQSQATPCEDVNTSLVIEPEPLVFRYHQLRIKALRLRNSPSPGLPAYLPSSITTRPRDSTVFVTPFTFIPSYAL